MNATTIQELMIFHCTSKFDTEENETVYVKEFLSHNDIEVEKEAKEDDPDELGIKQIVILKRGMTKEEEKKGRKKEKMMKLSLLSLCCLHLKETLRYVHQ